MLHLANIRLIELSDTPLPKVVLVSLNPITPMFAYNRGHTEGSSKRVSQVNIDLEMITELVVRPNRSCYPI